MRRRATHRSQIERYEFRKYFRLTPLRDVN